MRPTLRLLLSWLSPSFFCTEESSCRRDLRAYYRTDTLPQFDFAQVRRCSIVLVGVGGLGALVAHGLAQAGVGRIIAVDPDRVEWSNLNRGCFTPRDAARKRHKAFAVRRFLTRSTSGGSTIEAHKMPFSELRLREAPTIFIVAVDNDETRLQVERFALQLGRPVVVCGLDEIGQSGYCFVSDSSRFPSCLRCFLGYDEEIDPEIATQACGEHAAAYEPLVRLVSARVTHVALQLVQRLTPQQLFLCRIDGATDAMASVPQSAHCRSCSGPERFLNPFDSPETFTGDPP